ncbi:MAG: hypothetical protein GY756_26580 [bacterium]|nr:hypothetical protein [bacterium]
MRSWLFIVLNLGLFLFSCSITMGTELTEAKPVIIEKKQTPRTANKKTKLEFKYTKLTIINYTNKSVLLTVNYFKNGIHLTKEAVTLFKSKRGTLTVDNGSDVNISYVLNGKKIVKIVKAQGKTKGVLLRP